MRLLCLFAALPFPAFAWAFSPDPICTLSHQNEHGEIVITYDATLPEYALTITLENELWPSADGFRMVFSGGREIDIATTRHQLSEDQSSLSVRDRGFSNVLDGLEFNDRVASISGTTYHIANLAGIGPSIAAFRACPASRPATS